MLMKKMLSICIVNFNTRELLNNCLHSIYDTAEGIIYEIIVVDNNSSDGSVAMIKQDFPHVILIANNENSGYASAVNQAVNQAQGEFILILNSDTEILPDSLSKTLEFMKKNKNAGIVGCRILNPDETLQRSCRSFPNILNFLSENFYLSDIFPRSRIFGKPFMTYLDYDRIEEVDVVLGAFMMIRRETIEQIGLMDTQFFMFAEETDWCYRAKQAGWKIYFYPGAEIVHYGGGSTKQNVVPMFIEMHKSHHKFIEKYHGPVYLLLAKIILVAGIVLRVFLFSLASLLKSAGVKKVTNPKADVIRYWETLKWYFGLQ
jgi:GT2 family glycosyltransferase